MTAFAPQPSPEEDALERELREFNIAGPRPGLKARIRARADELGIEPPVTEPDATNLVRFPALQTWISSAAALIALAFGFALWLETQKQPSVATADPVPRAPVLVSEDRSVAKPYTLVDQVLINQANDGVIVTEDGQPMWRLRYDFMNRTEWQDPATGETRQHLTPEQRVFFMPVRHD